MKKLFIAIFIALLNMISVYAQREVTASTTRKEVFAMGPNSKFSEMIRQIVEDRVNEWQKRGKTETSAAYQQRMARRDALIKQYTEEALLDIKKKQLTAINWRFDHTDDYDPDNATYRLTIDNKRFRDIVLPVPVSEVESFDQAYTQQKLIFKNQDIFLRNNSWILRYFQVTNGLNGKTYNYDSRQNYMYNPTEFHFNFERIEVEATTVQETNNTMVGPGKTVVVGRSDVDINLPKTRTLNPEAVAVVIGNTDYIRTKRVDFAVADARAVKKYLIEVLGFKEGNIFYKENASKADFEEFFGIAGNEKGRLYNAVRPGISDVFVFYAGHGAPGIDDKRGYFVPIGSDPLTVNLTGYPADVFYQNLSKSRARHVTVVLDACFSGAELLEGVSPIVIQSKGVRDIKGGILLASSSNDQVSTWYPEKEHGLFTYFFLKGIQTKAADLNRDNKITFAELHQYVSDNANGVPYYARRLRNVDQIPSLDGEGFDRVLVEY